MKIITGDLLTQDVACIVNPWNVNIIPRWLFLPAGVSGQLKKKAGSEPFRELARFGWLSPGCAVLTGGGLLKKPVIHVAGLNLLWRSSESLVFRCTRSALTLAGEKGLDSVALPLIGAGTGGLSEAQSRLAIETAVNRGLKLSRTKTHVR
ncbi:macro domain-containing protein [Pantoea ananatis]|uniref:macro domain-containing protein n=1 Tax=Pantoea ananas TaxID=553 RepID=UPI001B313693|nr:macro domain-containing protein [Pantoea ananatis]